MSATPESTLTDPEQRIADLERQLAERDAELAGREAELAQFKAERDEALQREMATTEVLQVINSSPGDLAPVFDAILEKAHSLCHVAYGSLWMYDGEYFHPTAVHGDQRFVEWLRQRGAVPPLPGTPFARITGGESSVQVIDAAADPAYTESSPFRDLIDTGGIRTLLAVALRKDSELLGTIVAYLQEVCRFSGTQIALLQNFAAQAVIAMENARLITETREALEQQTATAEVLGVINASPGDLGPVFDAILEKAMRLCDAASGALATFDGNTLRTAVTRGLPPAYASFRMNNPPAYGPKTAPGRFIAGERLVHNIDLKTEELYREGDPNRLALVDLGGARTALQMALRKDDALLGSMTIYRQEVRPFSDKQIALLQSFAAQAVIAMENARLITETYEALEQQTATAEVLGVINSSPGDLAPVFDAILEKATGLCDATYGQLATYDGECFRFVAKHGRAQFLLQHPAELLRPSDGITWECIVSGAPVVHIPDVADTGLYRDGHGAARAVVDIGGGRTLLTVALQHDAALLGSLTVYRQEVRPFSDKQIALLRNFAAQAVIAMENARLLDELRQRTDEVSELNRGLEARVAEQVEELGRVGRLKRFLAPQLAELIVSQGDEKILESHRREIVVVFCDLRGYTAFTETAEPEEVLDFLREYHGALGPLVSQFEGTLDQFSGDGIMVFFNDPVPCPDPAERAVKMAMAMREAAGDLITAWRERGRELGFGAGIAQGYATLGQIGFSDRSGYTAIGTVCNVAARLCAEATDGQILVSQRVNVALKGTVTTEQLGALTLKGLTQPVAAYNVPLAASQPALRVIEGRPESV